jgi:DNA-3-methyladenine glycosylase II
MKPFNKRSFNKTCIQLSAAHPTIYNMVAQYGVPPMFQRDFSFETVVKIILEQQVSLASGRAAYNKLLQQLGEIHPTGILSLDVDALRACSVSRQKAGYLHNLSQRVLNNQLDLEKIPALPDDEVRKQLMVVKGIGPWTVDVVLMLCLKRPDVFPLGDVALVNSVRHQLAKPDWTLKEIGEYATRYKPYRTIAAYCYWHAYIQRKNIKTPV